MEMAVALVQSFEDLKPATRVRKQTALNSFFTWAYRQDLIAANPMVKLDPSKREPPDNRVLTWEEVEKILNAIPARQRRDRLLFQLVFETGLRVGETLHLHFEDLDMTLDDEYIRVLVKARRPCFGIRAKKCHKVQFVLR